MTDVPSMYPHGGPYPLAELREKYPSLTDADIDLRRRCVADPLFLGAEILGRELLRTPSTAHREVALSIARCENTLYVDHRGTLKTTLLDEIGTVHLFARFPHIRILFLQSSAPNANAQSRKIRGYFLGERPLTLLFPEYRRDSEDDFGNVTAWTLPCKRSVTEEGSFNVGTPGTSLTGLHFEVIKASDLMNTSTTPPPCGLSTIENMKATIDWYASTDGLLVTRRFWQWAHKTYDSNRWHDGDHVAQLLRADPKQPEDGGYFRKVIRGVTRAADGHFIATWPEVIPSEELAEIRARPSMTAATWAANYCSDPMPDGGVSFKREWFHRYDKIPDTVGRIAITVDSATTDKAAKGSAKSDRSALVVSGIDSVTKNLYVLQTVSGRWTLGDLIEQVWALVVAWRAVDPYLWVGLEEIGAGVSIKQGLINDMQRSGRMYPYRDVMLPGNKTTQKEARIGPLHAFAQNLGGIWVHRDGRHEELVEELLRFGVAEHDDLADALGLRGMDVYADSVKAAINRPEITHAPKRKPVTSAEIIARANERTRLRALPPWGAPLQRIG